MGMKSNLELGILVERIEFQSYNPEQPWAHENEWLLFVYSTCAD